MATPRYGSDEQMLGAFEVINKLAGEFTADDEQALVELAAHAALGSGIFRTLGLEVITALHCRTVLGHGRAFPAFFRP